MRARISSGETPSSAQALQRQRPVALGETAAAGVRQQRVVLVGGHRQAQQPLQAVLYRHGEGQVLAARHQRDALERVVHDRGEMVAGADILAGDDRIVVDEAERIGVAAHHAVLAFGR